MANVYVYNGAAGAGTGADWTNAYTTFAAAATAKAAGDVFFIAHDHAESQASAITIVSPGSDSTPCRAYCVNRAGSFPPVSADLRATASIACTVGNLTISNTFSELYGVAFTVGDGSATTSNILIGNASQRSLKLVNCKLKINNSSSSSQITLGNNPGGTINSLDNTTLEFGHILQKIVANGRSVWRNTPNALAGAIIPTTLLAYNGGSWLVEGVDLSAATTGKILFGVGNVVDANGILKDCKLGAGVAISTNAGSMGGAEAICLRSDSGDTNYRTEKWAFTGTLTTETTIVRSDGASDGTTPVSWKIVTTVPCKPEVPFECLPISIWNETVGSPITVTLYGTKATAVPNNGQVWMDVYYLGTSGFPISSKATSGKADGLATTANLSSDGSTWGGSLSTPSPFSMSVTITPQEKGPITIYPRMGVASTTVYIDPKPVVT